MLFRSGKAAKQFDLVGYRINCNEKLPSSGKLKEIWHTQSRYVELVKTGKAVGGRHDNKNYDRTKILDETTNSLIEKFA